MLASKPLSQVPMPLVPGALNRGEMAQPVFGKVKRREEKRKRKITGPRQKWNIYMVYKTHAQ